MIKIEILKVALIKMNAQIEALSTEKLELLRNELCISLKPSELFAMQEAKSIAQASGKIDLEVALWAYRTINHWVTSPLADKVVLLEVMRALAGK
jgi:hypothetical protein